MATVNLQRRAAERRARCDLFSIRAQLRQPPCASVSDGRNIAQHAPHRVAIGASLPWVRLLHRLSTHQRATPKLPIEYATTIVKDIGLKAASGQSGINRCAGPFARTTGDHAGSPETFATCRNFSRLTAAPRRVAGHAVGTTLKCFFATEYQKQTRQTRDDFL